MKASVKFLLITWHRTVVWASKYRNKVHENKSFRLESLHQLEHNWSEEMAGTLLDSSQLQPSLWFQYGDDTFEVWSHGKVTMTHSYPAYCKTRNRLRNGLILRTHWSESMLWSHAEMTTSHTVQVHEHYRPLHELKLSFEPGLSILDFVWKLQASSAGLQDLVINVQQAMVCIAPVFYPGMICFELKSRSDQPRT